MLTAIALMVTLPSHTTVQLPIQQSSGSLFHVSVVFTGANAAYGFYLYAVNAHTGEFYEFDYQLNAFVLPAGTYYFDGEDASGSGWCGVSGTQATVSANTTIIMNVWCE